MNTAANGLSADTNKNKTAQPSIVTVIKCDICNYDMDSTCSGIPSDAVNKLLDIIQYTGWVCTDCRTNSQQKIDKLQAALTLVNEKLSDLMATVDNLQQNLRIQQDLGTSTTIMSCLKQILLSLSCLGSRRLGKVCQQKASRKLLVHLTSEQATTDVLTKAKKLRYSDDPVVASTVYINPDLSPAASQLAYEKHQRKRLARQRRTDVDLDILPAVGNSSALAVTGTQPTNLPTTQPPKQPTSQPNAVDDHILD